MNRLFDAYRIFHWSPIKGGGYIVRSQIPKLHPKYPESFVWVDREDRDGLRAYIDAVLAEQWSQARAIEGTGAVTEIVYPAEEEADPIYVDPVRFLQVLTMRDPRRIPLPRSTRFYRTSAGRPLAPADLPGALFDGISYGKHLGVVDAPTHTGAALDDLGSAPRLKPQWEAILRRGPAQEEHTVPESLEPPQAPPAEVEVTRDRRGCALVIVSRVTGQGAPYFVKRVVDVRTGRAAYTATSYFMDRGWRVWERDNTLLMTLGIALD